MVLVAATLFCVACDPIEDESLRDKYYKNPGTPIAKAELQAALSITQPIANSDDKVEGDQYVVLKNSRPDVGGVWHIGTSTGEKTFGSDDFTYIYESNGTFNIYYVGISANQKVQTDPVTVTITNVFDQYESWLTGAKDKTDKSAKKTWEFAPTSFGDVCHMGAYGAWKYMASENTGIKWWGGVTLAVAGEQTMVFEYDGSVFKTFNADGSERNAGKFGVTHTEADKAVLGELVTTIPLPAGNYDDLGQKTGQNNTFWIVTFTENKLSVFHPDTYSGGGDWENYGWYGFYKAKN